MNIDLLLMLGALILLAISGLLVFCFTESKGKNTPYARQNARIPQKEKHPMKVTDSLAVNKELV